MDAFLLSFCRYAVEFLSSAITHLICVRLYRSRSLPLIFQTEISRTQLSSDKNEPGQEGTNPLLGELFFFDDLVWNEKPITVIGHTQLYSAGPASPVISCTVLYLSSLRTISTDLSSGSTLISHTPTGKLGKFLGQPSSWR